METPEILVQQCWMVRKIIQVIPIGKFVLMLQKAANWSLGKYESELIPFAIWVVVSDIFYFQPYPRGNDPILTCHIFFNWGRGKNQQESCPFNQPNLPTNLHHPPVVFDNPWNRWSFVSFLLRRRGPVLLKFLQPRFYEEKSALECE